jgi:sugar lactone lactonase YvrE
MTSRDEIRPFIPAGDWCGEAAMWSADESAVYWVDINRFLIHRATWPAGETRTWIFDEPVTALAPTTRPGTILVALGSRLILWQPADGRQTDHGFRLAGWPDLRFNDGRAGPAGEFWVGSMANNVGANGEPVEAPAQPGTLYRIGPDGAVEECRTGLGTPNTLAWSPDRRHFYTGDSRADIIWRYDYDAASGAISNPIEFLDEYGRGVPDGSAVDAEGFLWNCRHGGGALVRLSPEGRVDRVIEMPVAKPTTCTFGGQDLRTLFITTAALDHAPTERFAGALFTLETETPGQPENRFRLP